MGGVEQDGGLDAEKGLQKTEPERVTVENKECWCIRTGYAQAQYRKTLKLGFFKLGKKMGGNNSGMRQGAR